METGLNFNRLSEFFCLISACHYRMTGAMSFSMKAMPLFLIALSSFLAFPGFAAETNRSNFDLIRQLNDAFVQVAETVSPAVVVLTVTEKQTVFAEPDKLADPEQYEYWRKHHRQFDDDPAQGQGSGIIVKTNGFILTNRHVIEDAEKIQVRLFDGRVFTAKIRGVDPQSDVAVVKIEATNLPAARLGDSSKVRVGEFAIAIGAPFSLDYSVTFGHVSAKSRGNVIPFYLGGQMMDQDFIQTDADINPGNSGGPLVNIEGEVIGVNTLIRGLHTGIGFAIPINLARDVAEKLITEGKFLRPWLGVEIRALRDEPELRGKIKGVQDGVVVKSIVSDGPAAHSELRENDIILAVNNHAVSTAQELRGEIRSQTIGKTLTLKVFRDGSEISVAVKPGEYTQPAAVLVKDENPKPRE